MSKSPGTAMTCLNSMQAKAAYKDWLAMVKSDLQEDCVRGLCVQ